MGNDEPAGLDPLRREANAMPRWLTLGVLAVLLAGAALIAYRVLFAG